MHWNWNTRPKDANPAALTSWLAAIDRFDWEAAAFHQLNKQMRYRLKPRVWRTTLIIGTIELRCASLSIRRFLYLTLFRRLILRRGLTFARRWPALTAG